MAQEDFMAGLGRSDSADQEKVDIAKGQRSILGAPDDKGEDTFGTAASYRRKEEERRNLNKVKHRLARERRGARRGYRDMVRSGEGLRATAMLQEMREKDPSFSLGGGMTTAGDRDIEAGAIVDRQRRAAEDHARQSGNLTRDQLALDETLKEKFGGRDLTPAQREKFFEDEPGAKTAYERRRLLSGLSQEEVQRRLASLPKEERREEGGEQRWRGGDDTDIAGSDFGRREYGGTVGEPTGTQGQVAGGGEDLDPFTGKKVEPVALRPDFRGNFAEFRGETGPVVGDPDDAPQPEPMSSYPEGAPPPAGGGADNITSRYLGNQPYLGASGGPTDERGLPEGFAEKHPALAKSFNKTAAEHDKKIADIEKARAFFRDPGFRDQFDAAVTGIKTGYGTGQAGTPEEKAARAKLARTKRTPDQKAKTAEDRQFYEEGGYEYTDPETGEVARSATKEGLHQQLGGLSELVTDDVKKVPGAAERKEIFSKMRARKEAQGRAAEAAEAEAQRETARKSTLEEIRSDAGDDDEPGTRSLEERRFLESLGVTPSTREEEEWSTRDRIFDRESKKVLEESGKRDAQKARQKRVFTRIQAEKEAKDPKTLARARKKLSEGKSLSEVEKKLLEQKGVKF